MSDSGPRITEEQARRLWERAAQLQAEAARREEEEKNTQEAGASTGELLPGETDEAVGYSLANVRQAAAEVGIPEEYLELAYGEGLILAMEGGGEERPIDVAAARFLSDREEFFELRRRYPFPPRAVWPVLERALTDHPQEMELVEVRGGSPMEGGLAVFQSPYSYQRSGTLQYYATVAEVRRFLVRLIPEEEGESCQVQLYAPLRRSRRVNFWVGSGLAGGGGVLGGFLGMALGTALVGTATLGALPLASIIGGSALLGGAGGGGLTRMGYNALYRQGFRFFRAALEKVLSQVERELDPEARRWKLLNEGE